MSLDAAQKHCFKHLDGMQRLGTRIYLYQNRLDGGLVYDGVQGMLTLGMQAVKKFERTQKLRRGKVRN